MYETGVVYLAGAGVGTSALLTRRCVDVLAGADVVVFDSNLPDEVRELFPIGCERIEVGPGGETGPGGKVSPGGESISATLVDRAEDRKMVVRLYGGDPYYSPGCVDEAKALTREGIPFEVIPGLIPSVSAPTFAGIPLGPGTEAGSFSVAEFPLPGGRSLRESAYCRLAGEGSTLVFTTRSDRVSGLSSELMAGGVAGSMPVAVIVDGGSPAQRVIESTLEAAPDAGEVGKPPAACVVVVGEATRLRWELNWFEGLPLHGRRILITRPREQADRFARLLEELGAGTLIAPTIRITAPEDWGPLDAAVAGLDSYDWVIFTSVNGVRFFADRLLAAGRDARSFGKGARILAIGPATARALEDILRLKADGVPERYVAEGILEMMPAGELKGRRVLIPRALEAREILPETLGERGAEVDVVSAYRTLPAEEAEVERIRAEISGGGVEMVTFTSSSTVRNFVEMLGEGFLGESMGRVAVASIGPVTSRTARELGLEPRIEAEVSTIPGLARAIVDYYRFSPAVDWRDAAPWAGNHE